MRRFLVFLAAAFAPALADARTYDDIMTEARAAFESEDFAKAADLLDEAQAERPYSLYLTRNRILTRLLTDRMDEAIVIAAEIADRGLVLETPPHEAFDRMRAEPAFAPIAERMAANSQPVGDAAIVFEMSESGLLPEAVARTPSGDFFVGSVRSGAIVKKRGASALESGIDALGGVFDIEVRGDTLWAAVNNQLAFERATIETPFAGIATYDLKSGVMTREVRLVDENGLFGDLEVDKNGVAYASDSLTPRIFVFDDGILTLGFEDPRFVNLQGLALDEANNRLFIADYLVGLFVIDLETRAVTAIENPTNAHLGGIDGLYLYEGDLIGIQNGTSPLRIVQIDLDKKGSIAQSLTVLQQAQPDWNEPTHGVVDGDTFYYIATSNWPAYDDEGNLRDDARLEPLRIMSVPLN